MRNAISSGLRASTRSIDIEGRCCTCGEDETNFHLFFSCHFVHAVLVRFSSWFAC